MSSESAELQVLRSIEAKLGALLAITLDDYVRTHEVQGARSKRIEQLLSDAGLSTSQIATSLGKTQRAVQLALQASQNG